MSYGPHLTFDCKSDSELLDNKEAIERFLAWLPTNMGMTPLTKPQVVYAGGGDDPSERGITGFIIIEESHISIHTYPVKNYFFLDIFSCKYFDTDDVSQQVLDYFEVSEHKRSTIMRGLDFPR